MWCGNTGYHQKNMKTLRFIHHPGKNFENLKTSIQLMPLMKMRKDMKTQTALSSAKKRDIKPPRYTLNSSKKSRDFFLFASGGSGGLAASFFRARVMAGFSAIHSAERS